MIPPIILYIFFGVFCVACIIGAIAIFAIVAWFDQWIQSRSQLPYYSQSIRDLDGGRVYVDLRALKQDDQGYFIPGYGRIRQAWDNADADPVRQMPEVKRWKGKVALICYDQTESGSDVREYIIGDIVPL